MSWSIVFIGKPKQVVEAMQKETDTMSGASKTEYEQALPHLAALIGQNFAIPETEWNPPTMRISANGHGVFNEGKQVNNQLRVTIETLDGRLV